MSNTFTRKSVFDAAANDIACVIDGEALDYSDNAAEIVEMVVNGGYYAPEVIYYADAYEICAGSAFNDVSAEDSALSFEGCDSALQCLSAEANAIVDAAYRDDLARIAQTIADFIENMADEMETHAGRTVENVRGVSGYTLGHIPHDLEFDVDASSGETVSVCVWKSYNAAAFRYEGIYIQCDLIDANEE